MSEAVFRRESAVEYFKELVDGALAHQGLATQRAHRVLRRAAADRLSPAAGRGDTDDQSRWHSAWRRRSKRRLRSSAPACRQIGDVSLFISGFFSDSLRRKLVDVDYYVSIGGYAYNALSRVETDTFSPVFAELATKFVGVRGRPVRGQRADVLRLERRPAAAVREVAEDRQPPQRPAAGRARRRAERLHQDGRIQ